MTKLVLVPLEPLTERYTESWYRNLPGALSTAGFEVTVIDGVPLQKTVKVGAFLDINSTVHYKMTQLQKIAAMFDAGAIESGTVFFFSDIEFWGLESVRLMAQLNGIDIKMAGFCHAASYTVEDAFSVAAYYQKYTELGWLQALDLVMVGSKYHKRAIHQRRILPYATDQEALLSKIVVTGNPLFRGDYASYDLPKQNLVLLTNRLDQEKRPLWTLRLFELAKKHHPDWTFGITSGRAGIRSNSQEVVSAIERLVALDIISVFTDLNKDGYHRLLAQAKVSVSHSIEENFGYCLVEGAHYGCAPMCPADQSHVEIVSLYSELLIESRSVEHVLTDEDLARDLAKLEWLMANPWYSTNVKSLAAPYFGVPEIMASHLLGLT